MSDKSSSELAADIVVAALTAKALTLAPDPRTKSSTAEHDATQIARAYTVIHDAIVNEQKRISSRK
jgi:hypothetical protein